MTSLLSPEFHVWDFSDRIEIRLSDELIVKIRNLKQPKVSKFIHYKSKKEVVVTRYYWPFPIASSIGQRLFSDKDWHHGKIREHLPFITVAQLREVQMKTGLSFEELERGITHVRTCSGTEIRLQMSFPVRPNSDWAALFGWWFAAGGKVTRRRQGRCEEKTLRFSVDARPYRELIVPVLKRIGYQNIPLRLGELYYVKKGGHKLDAHKRQEYGALPRGYFIVHRPVREIMEKWGLPTPEEHLKRLDGIKGKRGFRQVCKDQVPEWIKEKTEFMHAFVEAYLNGPSAASQFRVMTWSKKMSQPLVRFIEPRFIGKDVDMVERFYSLITDFLAFEGIIGYRHKLPEKHKQSFAHELGYLIVNDKDLRVLNEKYRIVRSDARARLLLHCNMTPVLYELCRRLSTFEILIIGAICERAYTVEGLVEDFRCDRLTGEKSLLKLCDMGVLACEEGSYSFEPSKWLSSLNQETKGILSKMQVFQVSILQQCVGCGEIFTVKLDACSVCGGKLEPISRKKVLVSMNNKFRKLSELQTC